MTSSIDEKPTVASPAEAATSETGAIREVDHIEKVPRDAFAKVRGELTDEEFATPAVSRMLLDRISDLRSQLREEKPFRDRFHQADKDRAVLEEKFKTRISSEVMFGVCLSAGSVLVSLAPTIQNAPTFSTILIWIGITLFVGAVVSRIIILKKK